MSDKKYFLVIDVELCQDCGTCYLACKDEHYDNEFPGYSVKQPRHRHRWISQIRKERGHGSLLDVYYFNNICMQCDDAPCVKNAGNAVKKRKDGIVLIDPAGSARRKELLKACPYGAIAWNDEAQVPQKCTMCAHLLDSGWKETRCTQVCPTGALKLMHMTDEERLALIKKDKLEAYRPEFKTRPGTLYKNLYRFTKGFIAGSVSAKENGLTDCVENAKVFLEKSENRVANALTDNYGDFKFDGLEEDGGKYTVTVDAGKKGLVKIDVFLNQSVYLENITL